MAFTEKEDFSIEKRYSNNYGVMKFKIEMILIK